MATQTKTINAGPVGIKPRGAYSSTDTYTMLDCVLYNHDSWVCTAMTADGSAATVSGQAPYDGSQYWKALTDGGRAAVAEGAQVRTDFDTWFGATANAGIRKTVSDWLTAVQTAWTEWFSDTLATGVRKIWSTWFSQRQTEWSEMSSTAVTDHTTAVTDHTIAQGDHTVADTDHSTANTDHTRAVNDHSTAEDDHALAQSDHTTALADHSTAADDHTTALADHASVAGAENVNAQLSGMTVTVTNRHGVSTSVNIGFEIAPNHVYASKAAMKADAANVLAGQFCMIATTDPTSTDNATLWSRNSQPASASEPFTFLSDLDQASTSAWADWMNNYKPVIESDHATAVSDHSTASTDHATASTDHTRAESDHSIASSDHTTASSDHTRAESDNVIAGDDHAQAVTDHSTAAYDHGIASADHTTADGDHTQAASDHTQATSDHGTASTDHSTASSDHTQAETDHTRANTDHTTSQTASSYANTQGDYAKNIADHPAYLADGTAAHPGDAGYLYSWDYTTQQYVKGARLSIDFDSMTPEQREELAQAVLAAIGFDDIPTENSEKAVKSGGLYTAFSNVNTAIGTESTRAQTAEGAISDRVTTIEGIGTMTAAQVTAAWDEIFNS